MRITDMLDKIANSLEAKGLIKEAYEIDKISMALEEGKSFLSNPSVAGSPNKPFLTDIRSLLNNDPLIKELGILPTDIPKNKEEVKAIINDISSITNKQAASILKPVLTALLGIMMGAVAAIPATAVYDLYRDLTDNPNEVKARHAIEFIQRSFPNAFKDMQNDPKEQADLAKYRNPLYNHPMA